MDHEVSSAMSGCHIYQVSSSLLVQDLDVCAYVASSSSSDVRPNLQTTCIPVVGEDLIAAAPKRISYLRWFDISTHTPMSDKSSYQARQVLCFLSITCYTIAIIELKKYPQIQVSLEGEDEHEYSE